MTGPHPALTGTGTHHRVGKFLLVVGACVLVAAAPLTPPWTNAGLAMLLCGWALLRPRSGMGAMIVTGLLFWALAASSLLWTWLQSGARPDVSSHLFAWTAAPLIAIALHEDRWRRIALYGLLATVALSTIVAALQFTIGYQPDARPWRIDSASPRRWNVASGLAPHTITCTFIAGLAFLTFIGERSLPFAWRAVGILMAMACVGMAASRGPLVGLAAGTLCWALLSVRHSGWRPILPVVTAAACGSLIAWHHPQRFAALLSGQDDRWIIWKTALDAIIQYPVLGTGGLGPYRLAISSADLSGLSAPMTTPEPHNSWLSLAAYYGIPAMMAALANLVVTILYARREAADLALPCALVVYWLVAGCFESFATHAVPSAAFFAVLGVSLAATHRMANTTKHLPAGTSLQP